jgi:serine/threonine protein kinase
VEPDVESDLYKGDDIEGAPAESGSKGQMSVPGGAAAGAMGMAQGSGLGLGGPAEGMPAAPKKETGWESGPDGDSCVDGQEKPEVPTDTFVGKTNFLKWTAGPDGSNAIELGEMRSIIEGSFTKELNRKQSADRKINDMLVGRERSAPGSETNAKIGRIIDRGEIGPTIGDAIGFDSEREQEPKVDASPPGPEQGPKRPLNRPGPGTIFRGAMGAQKIDPRWEDELGPVRDAVKGAKGKNDVALGNQIAKLLAIKNDDKNKGTDLDATFNQDERKRVDLFKQLLKLPAVFKDDDATQGMNEAIKGLLKDPDFDLDFDPENMDDYLDEGAFGSVYDKGDAVIKQGRLGPKELQALYAMRDSPYFPDLINARFDGPFKHQSSEYNNPLGKESRGRDNKTDPNDGYWDPQEQSNFDDKYPSAPGTYAMSKAKGGPLHQMWDELDEEAQEKAKRQFWEARGQLHQAGISHNDMHDGNIFVDEEGNIQIIDLGLANDNPLSALMEGMGGMNYEEGEDYQLGNYMGGSGAPESLRQRMLDNMEGVIEMIQDQWSLDGADYDDYDEEEDYSAKMSDGTEMIDRMRQGQIRMQPDSLELMGTYLPLLQNKDTVMSLIKRLYEGMGVDDEVEDESEVGQMVQSIKKRPGVETIIDRLRGKGGLRTGQSGMLRKALDPDD